VFQPTLRKKFHKQKHPRNFQLPSSLYIIFNFNYQIIIKSKEHKFELWLKARCSIFTADCNEMFPLNPEKNGADSCCRFREKRKNRFNSDVPYIEKMAPPCRRLNFASICPRFFC